MKVKMKQSTYQDIRPFVQPGDDFMFSGEGIISNLIKIATNSPITHIGSAFQTWDNLNGTKRVQLIESTQLDGANGVITPFLSERIENYNGNIWWCPLSDLVREYFDEDIFFHFMFNQQGKKYDMPQAIKSALDKLPFCENKEDLDLLFCSEIRTAGLKKATTGRIDSLNINASECTPGDCCYQNIHAPVYHQILGERTEILNYS